MQKFADLVNLEVLKLKHNYLIAKIIFALYKTENGPSKVWATRIPPPPSSWAERAAVRTDSGTCDRAPSSADPACHRSGCELDQPQALQ